MYKKITLTVPPYVAKFFKAELGFQQDDEVITIDRVSELGNLLYLTMRPIPYIQSPKMLDNTRKNTVVLKIRYPVREKVMEVPVNKLDLLAKQMEAIFKRTLITETRGIHEVVGGDYGPYVSEFLRRRGITEEDIDFQTARKIYRDYLERITKQNNYFLAEK